MSVVQVLTRAQIEALSTKELLAHFNALAEATGSTPVNRFADRAKGIERTVKLQAQFVESQPKVAEPEPEPAPAPARASAMPTLATLGSNPPAAPVEKEREAGGPRRVRRGTNITPFGSAPEPCREGSKQASLVDVLRRPNGATMAELVVATSGGRLPWQEVTVRAAFGWSLKNKGYGIRSEFDPDGTERFFLVLPPKFGTIPAHKPLKTATPKADARQARLIA